MSAAPRRVDPDGPHWRFAAALYGAPGAADACLLLQDAHRVNVDVLLVALYAARRGMPLTDTDLAVLDAAAVPWHEAVVRPLRTVRRSIKSGAAPAPPGPEIDALRQRVLGAEIEAERVEIAIVADALAELAPPPRAGTLREAALAVVTFYAGASDAAAVRAIEVLAAAAGDTSFPREMA